MLLQLNPFLGLPGAKSITSAITELPVTICPCISSGRWNRGAYLIHCHDLAKNFTGDWLPGPLIGLFVGTAVTTLLGLDIPKIGDVPTGLPELYLPNLELLKEAFVPAAALGRIMYF